MTQYNRQRYIELGRELTVSMGVPTRFRSVVVRVQALLPYVVNKIDYRDRPLQLQ